MNTIDIPTLVISGLILIGVTAPFIVYSIKNKKAKAQFLSRFNEYVSGLNLNVDIQEDWRNRYILALDNTNKALIYFQIGENEKKSHVRLQELSRAVVHQSYLNGNEPSSTNKSLEHVTLQLYFKDPSKKTLNLEIYNHEFYSDLLGETMLASKWAELVNQRLTK